MESLNSTETNNSSDGIVETTDISSLSKRQRKKLEKHKKFLENRAVKRKKEREIQKLKRKLNKDNDKPNRKFLKSQKMANSSCKTRIVVDCSFDDLMSCKDLGKCTKQLNFCYCVNRRAANPVQFYVCDFNGKIKKEMEKNEGFGNWDVHFESDPYDKVFATTKKEDLVYLSSDSDNVIEELNEEKIYIIGGLVDHNSHKGLCLKKAMDQGISHGRLPIDSFLKLKTRKVLTVNHVFQILVAVCNGSSWKDAFVQIIPSRKQVGATETEPKAKDIGMEVVENNTTDNTSDMPPDELDNLPSSKTNTDEDNR